MMIIYCVLINYDNLKDIFIKAFASLDAARDYILESITRHSTYWGLSDSADLLKIQAKTLTMLPGDSYEKGQSYIELLSLPVEGKEFTRDAG